ncbi:MAG TPA: HAMP domain-containing histidine kinase [Candidatus Eisenbergiella merdavium]|uniref:histidine kinase n=1 Tax=Candidatus Eisenbergiella merdavium TaxID=2838551 RepID=A0A9D2NHE2_9FIRM|nr:HAMP domain-containing histidine kinase [Candidatus Eisenbergiella merdavium]
MAVSLGVWALSLSILLACAVANPVRIFGGMEEFRAVAEPGSTWKQTEWFRLEIAEMLEDLIRIGAGQPVLSVDIATETAEKDAAAGVSYAVSEESVSYGSVLIGYIRSWASESAVAQESSAATTEDSGEKKWTPEEIERSAELFLKQHESDKNILYELKQDGQTLYDNLEGQVIGGAGNELPPQYDFLLKFDGEKAVIWQDGAEQDVYGDGVYEADGAHWRVPGYENYELPQDWKKSEITLAVRKNPVLYVDRDGTYRGFLYYVWSNDQWNRRYFAGYCAALAAALICLVPAFIWRRSRREARIAVGTWLGRIPGELRLAVAAFLIYVEFRYWDSAGQDGIGDAVFALAAFWMLWLVWTDLRFGRKLLKSSLLYRFLRFLQVKDAALDIQKRLERQFRLPLLISLVIPALLLWYICMLRGSFIPALTVVTVVLIGTLLFQARSQKGLAADIGALHDCISEICAGKEPEEGKLPADPQLSGLVRKVAALSDGLEEAVEERLKSERMKVELVTNVSHDIKTPLTSIISYVELLKQADGLPEELKDYVKILAQKSERLREIVQDVFEISRAASGQLPLKLERLDLGKLLRQTLADKKDIIEDSSFQLRVSIPEEETMILADGQRMYRVFANLLENALKYSLEGSRIFLDLKKEEGGAEVRLRNTSKEELKTGKDFTERFVRGDESRTDGGSGLGLSIAKSFTQACGGTFRVETAGDSFLVVVGFREERGTPEVDGFREGTGFPAESGSREEDGFPAEAASPETMEREAAAPGREITSCEEE